MKLSESEFNPVRTAQVLLGFDALIWAGLGFFSVVIQAEKYSDQRALYGLVGLMMLANSVAMLLAAWLLGKRKREFYLLTLAVMLVNILLTFTDQFGSIDMVTMLLDLGICAILILRNGLFFRGSDL